MYRDFQLTCFVVKSPVWKGKSGKNTRLGIDGRGKPRYFSRVRSKGRARLDWLEEHKLNLDSNPVDFVKTMMKIDKSENSCTKILFYKLTSWAKVKEILENMHRNSHGIIVPFTISKDI